MSQLTCTSLYLIDTRLWVSLLPERIGDPVKVDKIPHPKPDKFYRSGSQWIPRYAYIRSDDMIAGERLSTASEIISGERSIIADKTNFKDYSNKLLRQLVFLM